MRAKKVTADKKDSMNNTDVIAFCNNLDQTNEWDQYYPGNYIEQIRSVDRKNFRFFFGTVIDHRKGLPPNTIKFASILQGHVDSEGLMNVSFPEGTLEFCSKSFMFEEVSESGDRILWSKDILNNRGVNGKTQIPDLMSLFYKNGHLLRVYLHIDNPGNLIELIANSLPGKHKPVDTEKLLQILQTAIASKRNGDFENALKWNLKAIDMAPHDDRAYKNIAKVLLGTGHYIQAINALLMKIKLGMYYTNCSPDRPMIEQVIRLKQAEMFLDAHGVFSSAIRVGKDTFPTFLVPSLMKTRPICFDIAKLMWAEDDLYFYIGHCYICSFPKLFTSYQIPVLNLKALEMALLGQPGQTNDLRESTQFAPLFYIVGFLVCAVNIHNNLPDDSEETIKAAMNEETCVDLSLIGHCEELG